jgi:hypothetical protein
VPDVNITEPTPNLGNASRAIPGLKHHQLSVLDALPAESKYIRYKLHYDRLVYVLFFSMSTAYVQSPLCWSLGMNIFTYSSVNFT